MLRGPQAVVDVGITAAATAATFGTAGAGWIGLRYGTSAARHSATIGKWAGNGARMIAGTRKTRVADAILNEYSHVQDDALKAEQEKAEADFANAKIEATTDALMETFEAEIERIENENAVALKALANEPGFSMKDDNTVSSNTPNMTQQFSSATANSDIPNIRPDFAAAARELSNEHILSFYNRANGNVVPAGETAGKSNIAFVATMDDQRAEKLRSQFKVLDRTESMTPAA